MTARASTSSRLGSCSWGRAYRDLSAPRRGRGSRLRWRWVPGRRVPGVLEISVGGSSGGDSTAINGDGSVLILRSKNSRLDAVGIGAGNAGTLQYYRYDDRDRSLVCASCPQDGSAPVDDVLSFGSGGVGPNMTPLTENGDFAFATPTPLAGQDNNSAGPGQPVHVGVDAYEWRDGRYILLTDGVTSQPENFQTAVNGITPDGRTVFITVPGALTADAIDGFPRTYAVRIGGGFRFPEAPPPCSLEACQGPPSPAPTYPGSGSSTSSGPGNQGKDQTPRRARRDGS